MLTDKDIEDLKATSCEEQWNAICDRIKAANGNAYPTDWFPRVCQSGLMAQTVRSWKAVN